MKPGNTVALNITQPEQSLAQFRSIHGTLPAPLHSAKLAPCCMHELSARVSICETTTILPLIHHTIKYNHALSLIDVKPGGIARIVDWGLVDIDRFLLERRWWGGTSFPNERGCRIKKTARPLKIQVVIVRLESRRGVSKEHPTTTSMTAGTIVLIKFYDDGSKTEKKGFIGRPPC